MFRVNKLTHTINCDGKRITPIAEWAEPHSLRKEVTTVRNIPLGVPCKLTIKINLEELKLFEVVLILCLYQRSAL